MPSRTACQQSYHFASRSETEGGAADMPDCPHQRPFGHTHLMRLIKANSNRTILGVGNTYLLFLANFPLYQWFSNFSAHRPPSPILHAIRPPTPLLNTKDFLISSGCITRMANLSFEQDFYFVIFFIFYFFYIAFRLIHVLVNICICTFIFG